MKNSNIDAFIKAIRKNKNFSADITTDLATRLTMATDSSIYEVIPEAVCFPRSHQDIAILLTLAAKPEFQNITFSPRGAGTGTNGQSLTTGIMIDFTRHMNKIIAIDPQSKTATVQPGVVLDQLNQAVAQYDLFFAPMISTASRATLGGMFATDACGKGSCRYGQTGDHIIASTVIMTDGKTITVPHEAEEITKTLQNKLAPYHQNINERFNNLPRHLNGYNLSKFIQSNNLNDLLAGSEGTLAITTELTVKLTALPKYNILLVVNYKSFDEALRHAFSLSELKPTAIETIDDTILNAQSNLIIQEKENNTKAINLIEIQHEDLSTLTNQKNILIQNIEKNQHAYLVFDNKEEISACWDVRKKCVGILANLPGNQQPIPFVEDTAVPPEHLADFIQEFKVILDEHQLKYGMFGHADAGCIHIRPALDLKQEKDEKLLPIITEAVYSLVKKYRGLMWSEHGRGYRSYLAKDYFGEILYPLIQEIKTIFDPYNQLNPGKIASSLKINTPLVSLTSPLRAHSDKQIALKYLPQFSKSMRCNGNGACFHFDSDALICPTYHATRDILHSPKGRAILLRAWLKDRSNDTNDTDINHATKIALSGCLGCKACMVKCPVHINIPNQKASFLSLYFLDKKRPIKDHIIARFEKFSKIARHFPRLTNTIIKSKLLRILGLRDLPTVSTKAHKILKKYKNRNENQKKSNKKTIILIADAFTATYQPNLIEAYYQLLTHLEYTVKLAPISSIGKPAQVKGMIKTFEKIAHQKTQELKKLSNKNTQLIGIDPAFTLCFRDEYNTLLNDSDIPEVLMINEFLTHQSINIPSNKKTNTYYLFSHCHEKSLLPHGDSQWVEVFEKLGLTLVPIKTSCCGMAGSFGHEIEHYNVSKKCYAISMQNHIDHIKNKKNILITGFSCRCQVERFSHFNPLHPVEVLNAIYKKA